MALVVPVRLSSRGGEVSMEERLAEALRAAKDSLIEITDAFNYVDDPSPMLEAAEAALGLCRAVLKEWDERQACATCGGTGGAYDKWGHWLRCPNPDGIDEPVGGQQ